jgi:hypothetical protein
MPLSVGSKAYIPAEWFVKNEFLKGFTEEYANNGQVEVVILKLTESNWYLVELPDGRERQVSNRFVKAGPKLTQN